MTEFGPNPMASAHTRYWQYPSTPSWKIQMLYLSVAWTVIGLAALARSYILLMGENTPDARRKTATTTRVAGFTLIVVGAIQMLVWVFTA